ncbi:hypothetical protein PUN4_960056 [Paraburkholderia unamae]|nr:hypothetical protein PUN4_960056 [Paraburkholderia unamae]
MPLWAEGGQWGPKAAPGDDGEALVGQTSSSGVRASDALFVLLLHFPHVSHSLTRLRWTPSRPRF